MTGAYRNRVVTTNDTEYFATFKATVVENGHHANVRVVRGPYATLMEAERQKYLIQNPKGFRVIVRQYDDGDMPFDAEGDR